eukprot:scaffold4035_cov132-Isochrysis_galbana.AAC.10
MGPTGHVGTAAARSAAIRCGNCLYGPQCTHTQTRVYGFPPGGGGAPRRGAGLTGLEQRNGARIAIAVTVLLLIVTI